MRILPSAVAAERGTALHHALDHLFDKLPTREALQALSHEECTSLCYDAADVAVGYLRRIKKALMTPTFLRIEKERTAELLSKFLSTHLTTMALKSKPRRCSSQRGHATIYATQEHGYKLCSFRTSTVTAVYAKSLNTFPAAKHTFIHKLAGDRIVFDRHNLLNWR